MANAFNYDLLYLSGHFWGVESNEMQVKQLKWFADGHHQKHINTAIITIITASALTVYGHLCVVLTAQYSRVVCLMPRMALLAVCQSVLQETKIY